MEPQEGRHEDARASFVTVLLEEEAVGGGLLALCAIAGVAWASLAPGSYQRAVSAAVSIPSVPASVVHDVTSLVTNLLMVVFFAAIGLEVGRERAAGALQDNRTALLPIAAALGGMAGAAAVYVVLAALGGHGVTGGWGIPMATDVAFTLAALSLLGSSIPSSLRIFVLALAVADDIASVVVLALVSHQTTGLGTLGRLGCAAGVVVSLGVCLYARHRRAPLGVFILAGALVWWFLAHLGIEPTLAGVAVAVLIPTGAEKSPGVRLERVVAPLATFVVLPLFALVVVGVNLAAHPWGSSSGVVIPLLGARTVGKLLGILAGCVLVIRSGRGRLPEATTWRHLVGAALLCGIGFTVPLLFAVEAFGHEPARLVATKLALLVASVLCAAGGLGVLWRAGPARSDSA